MADDQHPRSHDLQEQFAERTSRFLVWAEDAIYTFTAILLALTAFVVLGHAVYDLTTKLDDGVIHAVEVSFDSLLIVFILVELLAAVRIAIDEHELVAEPFLLVGILAAIKELVVLATFEIGRSEVEEATLKISALAGVILILAAATWILRRRQREPKETSDT